MARGHMGTRKDEKGHLGMTSAQMDMQAKTETDTQGRKPRRAASAEAKKGPRAGMMKETMHDTSRHVPVRGAGYTSSPGRPVDGLGRLGNAATAAQGDMNRIPVRASSHQMREDSDS